MPSAGFLLLGMITLGIILFFMMINVAPPPPEEDTFYYIATDVNDKESFVHDSGIRPSETPPHSTLTLQILKTEYNNGVKTDLNAPKSITLGTNPKNLRWKRYPISIDDHDGYYSVQVEVPKTDLYGKTQTPPKRIEVN